MRGEEALGSWRPHGEELIAANQAALDTLSYLSSVEDTKQSLSLSDKIRDKANSDAGSGGRTRRRERREKKKRSEVKGGGEGEQGESQGGGEVHYDERQRELLIR